MEFDKFTTAIGYQLNDDAPTQYTGRNFNSGEIYYLEVTLNFASNRWSATLDGTPLIDGKPISTTSATLDLGDVDAGWFRVSGTFGDNYMAFDDYWITAEASEVPRIITPPASQSVLAGATVRLFVVADSPLQLAYQWQINGIDIPGTTGPVLDLYRIQVEQAGNYRVIVSNAAGSATSSVATLTVLMPPQILSPPTNLAVVIGQPALFSVTASGTGTLGYQWYLNYTKPRMTYFGEQKIRVLRKIS